MAFTTYAAFADAVADLSITGVTRALRYPPGNVNAADLPLSYVRIPEMTRGNISLGGMAGLHEAQIERVFLIEPAGLSDNPTKFDAMTALIDNIDTAVAGAIGSIGVNTWTIRQETAIVGDAPYWALVLTVEAS